MFETARFIDFLDQSAKNGRITLLPPVVGQQLDDRPSGLKDLARFAAGFEDSSWRVDSVGWEGWIGWDGPMGSDYLQGSSSSDWNMDVGADGEGNRWVLLIQPESGEPREVLWASHDAPVTLVAADSLEDLCRALISDPRAFVNRIGDRECEIWKAKPTGISVEQARVSGDSVLRESAEGLDESWRIYDLRHGQELRGVARLGIDDLRKHPTELVFARRHTEREPTRPWWKFW